MPTPTAKLDLAQFEGLTDDNDAYAALLSECKRLRAENERLKGALQGLCDIVGDARNDDDASVSDGQSGGYLFGDVMSDAYEAARAALEPQS